MSNRSKTEAKYSALLITALWAGAVLLSSCASGRVPGTSAGEQTAVLGGAQEGLNRAINLLGEGLTAQARRELTDVLNLQPGNASARELMDEIETDPKSRFGDRSFAYRVKPGETVAMLAQRFLGDRLLFYSLAKYNGVAAPSDVTAGQELQIPQIGRQIDADAARRLPKPTAVSAAARETSSAQGPAHDAVCAAKLRTLALEELDRGTVDLAVAHLRQALQCDEGDQPVSRDLERALRLQALAHAP